MLVKSRKPRVCYTLVAFCGLMSLFIALDNYLDPFDERPFDSAVWANANEQERGPMARDAMRHLTSGLPADQVRELLGEPTILPSTGDRWGIRPRHAETWCYWIGCWSAIHWYGYDSASLYVHFDTNGKVASSEIDGG